MFEKDLNNFFQNGSLKTAIKVSNYFLSSDLPHLGIEITTYFLTIFKDNLTLLFNLSHFYEKTSNYKLCFQNLLKLKQNFTNPEIEKMEEKCIPYIYDDFIFYDRNKVEKIMNKSSSNIPLTTFTMTTCKRYDLFEKTINSFLNCCLDLERIDLWLCVDDNSSAEDREKMKQNYPFFEFYFKGEHEKGHAESLNIIKNKVKTPYIFHIEDDWKFFVCKNYISDCIDVLNEDEKLGQCLINKNYAETEKDYIIFGGEKKRTQKGLNYLLHTHCEDEKQYSEFYKSIGGVKPNCAYWKHFSLRPSLIRNEVFRRLGNFELDRTKHFEAEYAQKYFSSGYRSAFLDSINCIHIGKLTTEKHANKANAYVLNNQPQFGQKISEKVDGLRSFIINLDRRKDRWEKINSLPEIDFLKIKRFSAIDGKSLKPNLQLQRIFENNDYQMRSGMVGCALSHIKLWIDLVYSLDNYYFILEDDVSFAPNFKEKFNSVLENMGDVEICFLGYTPYQPYKQVYRNDNKRPVLEKWEPEKMFKVSMGGAFGYIISKTGALKMLNLIENVGMPNCIDTMMQKSCGVINISHVNPMIVYSEVYIPNTNMDTNIQNDFSSLDLGEEIDEKRYPYRLVKGDIFNIDSALGTAKDFYAISICGSTHCSEAIKKHVSYSEEFPFDLIDGGDFSYFVDLLESFFHAKNIEELVRIVADFCLNNNRGVIFPHEKTEKIELVKLYFAKFQNLNKIVRSGFPIVFFHVSRWKKTPIERFKKLISLFSGFNKNIKVVSVNGIDEEEKIEQKFGEKIISKTLHFPEKFRYDHWDEAKVFYDQTVFRVELIDVVGQTLREMKLI